MKQIATSSQTRLRAVLSRATIAGFALTLGACQSSGSLWQGEEVLVEARQTNLERSVGTVSEDHRELKDRFNSLERLYVDLVRHSREQDAKLATLEAQLGNFRKDPATEMELSKLKGDVSTFRQQMKSLEGRIYSVEVSDNSLRQTSVPVQQKPATDSAPTGTAVSGADTGAAVAAATPAANKAAPDQTFYGVHLASYRSKDQVSGGWRSLTRAFGTDLDGLTPLVYVQSQDGIGTFLRLIVGPLITEDEAESLCARIRKNASEQYCRVSEYQGEPVE